MIKTIEGNKINLDGLDLTIDEIITILTKAKDSGNTHAYIQNWGDEGAYLVPYHEIEVPDKNVSVPCNAGLFRFVYIPQSEDTNKIITGEWH